MIKKNSDSQINKTKKTSDELASALDYGVDIQMLIDNLNRPIIERIKRHQIALNTFQKLCNAQKL